MNIPTKEECMELLREYRVADNIIRHSLQVNKIAIIIAKALQEKGIDVNIDLIDRATLLHDILRVIDIHDKEEFISQFKDEEDKKFIRDICLRYKDIHHAEAAYEELKDRYPEVAELILHHTTKYSPEIGMSWNQMVVTYSDKRVDNDKIVSLDTRYIEGIKRWKSDAKLVEKYRLAAKQLEKDIFKRIDLKPEDIR